MSNRYEKARAIAEAIANRWDKFGDSAGVQWLAERIENAIAAAEPADDSALVIGLPMLVLSGGRRWHVLGEDGARFKLALVTPAPASFVMAASAPDDRDLCSCKIGQCHSLTERCREMQS